MIDVAEELKKSLGFGEQANEVKPTTEAKEEPVEPANSGDEIEEEEKHEEQQEEKREPLKATDEELISYLNDKLPDFEINGVEGIEKINEILIDYQNLQKENEELFEQLEKVKEDPFTDANQRALFEFAKKYDGNNARAISDFERLKNADIDKMDAKTALREEYVLRNPKHTYSDSVARFERYYKNRYELDREVFERKYRLDGYEDEQIAKEYEHELEAREQDRDDDFITAKEVLKKSLAEIKESLEKPVRKEKQATKEEQIPEAVYKSIELQKKNFDKAIEKAKEGITFKFDKAKNGIDLNVTYKPTKEELTFIKSTYIDPYISDHRSAYKEDGTYKGQSPEIAIQSVLTTANQEKIVAMIAKTAYDKGVADRNRELDGQKPESKTATITSKEPVFKSVAEQVAHRLSPKKS